MRYLRPIIGVLAGVVPRPGQRFSGGRRVAPQPISDQESWFSALALQRLIEEPLGS
jgi:hypothetical protein